MIIDEFLRAAYEEVFRELKKSRFSNPKLRIAETAHQLKRIEDPCGKEIGSSGPDGNRIRPDLRLK